MKPRIRPLLSVGVMGLRWECGYWIPFFDGGWVYYGMTAERGFGSTPEAAFKAWQRVLNQPEAAADSAAQPERKEP